MECIKECEDFEEAVSNIYFMIKPLCGLGLGVD